MESEHMKRRIPIQEMQMKFLLMTYLSNMRTFTIKDVYKQSNTILPLEIMEYVQLIREEKDVNHIPVIINEACSIYTTDKQVSWLQSE